MNTRVVLQPSEMQIRLCATSLAVVTHSNVSGLSPDRYPTAFKEGMCVDKDFSAHTHLAKLVESIFVQTQSSLTIDVIDDFALMFLGIKHRIDGTNHYRILIVRRSDGILMRAMTPFGSLSATYDCQANARLKSLPIVASILFELEHLLKSKPTPCVQVK